MPDVFTDDNGRRYERSRETRWCKGCDLKRKVLVSKDYKNDALVREYYSQHCTACKLRLKAQGYENQAAKCRRQAQAIYDRRKLKKRGAL